ncbi:MAG TPA: diguanylate cyclase [Anaerolineales bacterium]|nr:diguanylate cyclase [Anaerolineales bacterium]
MIKFRATAFTILTILLLAVLPAVPNTVSASAPLPETSVDAIRFERLTVEDGLPNATVLSVLQDQQGFMWFATADGLSRYDGNTFTTFHHNSEDPNSLSNNNTFTLIESRDGLIWIGTDPGGLNVYDPATGKFNVYRHHENDSQSLSDDSVWSLLEAQDGAIWVGTRNGLSRLDRETGLFKNYIPNPEDPTALAGAVVYRIYQDKSGTIWVGTRNGLHRYNANKDNFTIFVNDPDDPKSISSNNVWAMLEDGQGIFWVATRGGGLNRFDRATGTFKSFQHDPDATSTISDNRLWSLFEDHNGNLWITTENGGLNLFNRDSETFTSFQNNPNDPFSLSHNDVFWVTEDRSGVLWITSRYGGVNKLYPSLYRFGLYRGVPGDPNTLNSNSVYTVLAEKNGLVWIGTFGGGINRLDRKTGRITVFKNDLGNPASLSNNKVYYIYRDDKNILWVTTSGGGLNRMDPVTGKFTAYKNLPDAPGIIGSNFPTVIESTGDGRLWVGTLGFGLDLFNPTTGKLDGEYLNDADNPNSLAEDTIYDIAVNEAGKVWIATARGGLDLFDPKANTFMHHFNNPDNSNSIASNTVHTIFLDENNNRIWAGTSSGLSMLNLATQKWKNFTSRDGLPSDTIVGIQPGADDDLWISTGKGISHLSIGSNTFRNYDVRDGLQGNQFEIASSHLGPDGEIFFGGSNGLTFFHPEQITDNDYLPEVVFTEFQLFGQTISAGSNILPNPIEKTKHITLSYDQSVFTLKFSALSYQISSKNLYQYKMEGFDKDWSPARTKQEATYTNLPPGDYTFLVRASNNDSVWNENQPQQLLITITPPWWQTTWFRIGVILSLVLMVAGGFQLRTRNIRAINRELEHRVNERTKELQDAQEQLSLNNDELKKQLKEITDLEQKVREMAIRDALTGLHNRHHLAEWLEPAISLADRKEYSIAFLLMDMDHFKDINDTYGHKAGDDALQAAAQTMTNEIRRSDIACRYGGEEFMVVMPDTSHLDALQRAEQFRKNIQNLKINHKGRNIQLTVSTGIAIYPAHGKDIDEILTAADTALYQAKREGRNKIVMYSPNADEHQQINIASPNE